MRIYLDKKDRELFEDKLECFAQVYKTLTTKDVRFDFQ